MHGRNIRQQQKKSSRRKVVFLLCVFCDFIILNINKLIHKMTMVKKENKGGRRGGLTRRETMYA